MYDIIWAAKINDEWSFSPNALWICSKCGAYIWAVWDQCYCGCKKEQNRC